MNTPPRTSLAQVGAPRKTLPHVTRLLTAGVTHPGTAFFRPTVPSVVVEQGSSGAPHLNEQTYSTRGLSSVHFPGVFVFSSSRPCSRTSLQLFPASRNVMLHGARSECRTRQRSCPLFFEKVGLQPSSRGGFHLEDGVSRPLFPYVSL